MKTFLVDWETFDRVERPVYSAAQLLDLTSTESRPFGISLRPERWAAGETRCSALTRVEAENAHEASEQITRLMGRVKINSVRPA